MYQPEGLKKKLVHVLGSASRSKGVQWLEGGPHCLTSGRGVNPLAQGSSPVTTITSPAVL